MFALEMTRVFIVLVENGWNISFLDRLSYSSNLEHVPSYAEYNQNTLPGEAACE